MNFEVVSGFFAYLNLHRFPPLVNFHFYRIRKLYLLVNDLYTVYAGTVNWFVKMFIDCWLFRFPVVTWRHPRTKALLLRASGFHGRGLMGMLKSDPTTGLISVKDMTSLHNHGHETKTTVLKLSFLIIFFCRD